MFVLVVEQYKSLAEKKEKKKPILKLGLMDPFKNSIIHLILGAQF